MIRILSVGLIACVIALAVWGALTVYDKNLSVGRMWITPAIKPHEKPIPVMAAHTVPFEGGEAFYRQADPARLAPVFALDQAAAIQAGQIGYQRFCVHCHGNNHDGMGTVGQSFAPLPGDLRSEKIQTMPVGQLFQEISYGVPGGRQPALASTISVERRWQIVGFVKSLGLAQK
jgi:mono/diheme cytochrome c family protein